MGVGLLSLEVAFNHSHKVAFALFEALNQGFSRIPWEVLTLYHIVVKIVSEILGTNVPTVAIEHSEKANLRPVPVPVLVLGLQDIQYDADSILIVLSYDPLISVRSVCLHDSALLI